MADSDGKTTYPIENLLEALEEKPYCFDFYHTLRLMEALYKEKPRLGTSKRPEDEPIRLCQEAALTFETSSLTGFRPGGDGKPHQLAVRLLGLLGPNGPLPLHLTEYVQARQRQQKDHTLADFLDIFHHRMLSLFYRAWANNEPVVSYDRPESDRFGVYIGALAGLAPKHGAKRNRVTEQSKLYYCGWLSNSTKCAEGLEMILQDYFSIPARVEEFVGQWLYLPEKHLCRPGVARSAATLGKSAFLGRKFWSCQHKFRLHLGPLNLEEFRRFLPAGDRIRRLVPLVRSYIGDELDWDVGLILMGNEVPSARLDGRSRLGWSAWIGSRPGGADSTDLILDAFGWVVGMGHEAAAAKQDPSAPGGGRDIPAAQNETDFIFI